MRTAGKLMVLAFILATGLALMPAAVSAQGFKMGFVDDEQIKLGYTAWQRAQEEWEIERKAWDDQAQTMQIELEEIISDYEKQQLILSDEKKTEREAAIRAKRDALDVFTRQIYGPGGTAERKQFNLIDPLLQNITKAIELVAIEANFDVILTMQSGIGYIKESFDITDKVLEQLDKIE